MSKVVNVVNKSAMSEEGDLFSLGKYSLSLSQPHIMGILNLTPDSFYDGGRWNRYDKALKRGEQLAAEGAAILDIGGESTRPSAAYVSEEEEIDRVLNLIAALSSRLDIPISVDTSRAKLMRLAAEAGASMINDVRSLRLPDALEAAAKTNLPVCLMHMQGEPNSMQAKPSYENVVKEVMAFLTERTDACVAAGIAKERLLIDPGFGFGKTFDHNLTLWSELAAFQSLGCPLLVGLSRKSFLGAITDRPPEDRLAASIMAAGLAVQKGVWILRVHDVAATLDAIKVATVLTER